MIWPPIFFILQFMFLVTHFFIFLRVQKNLRTKKDWLAKQKQVSINEAPQSQRNILTRAQILVLPLFVSFFLKKKKRKIFKKKNEKKKEPLYLTTSESFVVRLLCTLVFFLKKNEPACTAIKERRLVLCRMCVCVCVCVCGWVRVCVCVCKGDVLCSVGYVIGPL